MTEVNQEGGMLQSNFFIQPSLFFGENIENILTYTISHVFAVVDTPKTINGRTYTFTIDIIKKLRTE